MGSDTLVKEVNSGAQGCFWRNLKWGLGAITSVVLVGRIVLSPSKPKVPVLNNPVQPTPAPLLIRPSSTSLDYDAYFVSIAKDFPVSSDFDISSSLQKKGFRVTKDQAIEYLRAKSMHTPTRNFLESHTDWMYADWAELGIEAVPLMYDTAVKKQSDASLLFLKHDELVSVVDGMPNHEFFMEIAHVAGTSRKVIGSEKYVFMYDQANWIRDGMTASKFMGFLEFFTDRQFHGAFVKELASWKQTEMHALMPLEDDLDEDSTKVSFALMPRIKVPQALKEKCHSVAGDNITVSLDGPLELKILVLWGKAYMATCYSAICNPFASEHYNPGMGPRYVIYPDGKSQFKHGDAKWKGEQECAGAVDSHIKSRLVGALHVAQAAAKGVGAPWLRADVLLDDAAPFGAYLHRLHDSATSSSAWDKHSDRAMAVLARGFESRSKIIYPRKDTIRTPEDVLTSLGCKVRKGVAVTCQSPMSMERIQKQATHDEGRAAQRAVVNQKPSEFQESSAKGANAN